jgi:hypothetical protein
LWFQALFASIGIIGSAALEHIDISIMVLEACEVRANTADELFALPNIFFSAFFSDFDQNAVIVVGSAIIFRHYKYCRRIEFS